METCDSPLILFFKTEYVVIDNTVHPDKKLMAVTSSTPKESSTGLIMTPPPIPQIAPTMDAPKHTTKNIR